MKRESLSWIVMLLLVGCGGPSAALPVKGTVTVDGKPEADVAVRFVPTGAGHPNSFASARTDAEGHFTLINANRTGGRLARRIRRPFREDRPARWFASLPCAKPNEIPGARSLLPQRYRDVSVRTHVVHVGRNETELTFALLKLVEPVINIQSALKPGGLNLATKHTPRIHAHRIARCHCHHRGPHRAAGPRGAEGSQSANRVQCQNNLKQIGLALLSYHNDYRVFPQGIFGDPNFIQGGGPGPNGAAWSIHILPYLEQIALYQAISWHGESVANDDWSTPGGFANASIFSTSGTDGGGWERQCRRL